MSTQEKNSTETKNETATETATKPAKKVAKTQAKEIVAEVVKTAPVKKAKVVKLAPTKPVKVAPKKVAKAAPVEVAKVAKASAKKADVKAERTANNFDRNFGRIKFNGNAVHAVIAEYVSKNKPTLAQLKSAFPNELLKNYGVIQEIAAANK